MSDNPNVKVIGRLVWLVGRTPFEPRLKTIFGTNQPKLNAKGEQEIEYGFGLAVPKDQLQPGGVGYDLWVAMHGAAQAAYAGKQVPPAFAYKFKDGDGVDPATGQSHSQKTGYAGNYVFAMTTQFPIKFFINRGGYLEAVDKGIKCGDWVQVSLQVGAQTSAKPGLYLNANAVLLLQEGEAINNAPSGADIFGTAPVQLPSFIPAAPAVPAGVPGFGAPPPVQAAPPPQPQAAPHYGILPQAHQPQMPAAPPPVQQMNQVWPQQPAAPAPQAMPPQYAQPAGFPQPPQGYQQPAGMPPIPGVR